MHKCFKHFIGYRFWGHVQTRMIRYYPCAHLKRRLNVVTPIKVQSSLAQCTENINQPNMRNKGQAGSIGSVVPQFYYNSKNSSKKPNVLSPHIDNLPEEIDDDLKLRAACFTDIQKEVHIPGASTSGGTGVQNVKVEYTNPGRVLSIREINGLKRTFNHKIWRSMCLRRWDVWEKLFTQFRSMGLVYDEVTYSLKLHGYVLSHRHKSELAYFVIEEMKQALMHPAIIRLNENLLNSFFELHGIFCGPTRVGWQSIARLAWHVAVRLRRRREKRLRRTFYAMPPNELLKISETDIYELIEKEYEEALIPPAICSQFADLQAILEEEPYSTFALEEASNSQGFEDLTNYQTHDLDQNEVFRDEKYMTKDFVAELKQLASTYGGRRGGDLKQRVFSEFFEKDIVRCNSEKLDIASSEKKSKNKVLMDYKHFLQHDEDTGDGYDTDEELLYIESEKNLDNDFIEKSSSNDNENDIF